MKTKLMVAALTAMVLCGVVHAEDKKPASKGEKVIFLSDAGPLMIRLNVESDGKDLHAAWEDCVAKLHKYLDANGDDKVSKEEATRLPPTSVLFVGNDPFLRRIAAVPGVRGARSPDLDTNGDSKISRDELAVYLRETGGSPFRLENGQGQQVRHERVIIVNGVGGIDSGGGSSEAINAAVFGHLDADKDGKLTKDELVAAEKVFAKLDTDDDEMVSLGELMPTSVGPVRYFGNDADAVVRVAPPAIVAPTGPFVHVQPGQPTEDLVRQMLQRYGGKDAKVLSRTQFRLDEKAFKLLDRDENGELDATELARVVEREPDLDMKVRLGKKGDKETVVEILGDGKRAQALGAKVSTEKDGTVVLEIGVSRVEVRLNRVDGNRDGIRIVEDQEVAQFKNADTDSNGYLDEKEATASRFFQTTFKVMDRDGDGMLYEKEIKAYDAAIKDLQASAKGATCVLSASDQGRGLFDLFDSRRDSKLSVREIREAVKLITKLDRDDDGKLGLVEVPKQYQMSFDQGGGSGNGIFFTAAFPGGRQPAERVPELTEGPMWFRKWDRNRDGDVSRHEFNGTDAEFRKIDLDGDGLINKEEAEKFDAMMRK